MLHHKEHPEKPEDIMTAPISRQPPPPPHFTLSPIFWHEVLDPLHFYQFEKVDHPPFMK